MVKITYRTCKIRISKKYPNANMNNFEFEVSLKKTGDIEKTNIVYKIDEDEGYDITSKTFKKSYSDALYWKPRIWGTGGTVQPFVISTNTLPYNVRKFTRSGFPSNFEALETSWKETSNDITKMAIDKDDPYFASLLAAYIISHVGAISRKHLTGDNKVITSFARYYVCYHMKRFTENPRKMSPYITSGIKEIIKKNLPSKRIWTHKFVSTRAEINYWYSHHPNKHNIRNYRYRMSHNNTGILGIDYEEVSKIVNDSGTDWMCFIKDDSNGITKTGQILLQLAIESYVYAVLGSQAQTRWAIVGQGAKSLQTQQIFHRLVKDTITQDNPTKSISDMRTAIKNTNVVLNMAITPGIILIPSNMIILKDKVEGYNNVLTLATSAMKFGVNTDVNYVPVVSKPPLPSKTKPKTTPLPPKPKPISLSPKLTVAPPSNHLPYLFGSTVGLGILVSKFVL